MTEDHLPECDQVWNNNFSEEPCGICAALRWVREDQTKILNSRVMYQSGYTDGWNAAIAKLQEINCRGEL